MIKRTAKKAGLLIIALLALLLGVFLFTRPMLAPGFDSSVISNSLNPQGQDNSNTYPVEQGNVQGIGEKVEADSYLIYDENTGKIISARNPDTVLAIASLTKLMTALIVYERGDLNSTWAINSASQNNISPVLGLSVGDQVKVSDLVNAMLIGSANDAAAALGAYISTSTGQDMVELMNDQAKSLGMTSTHYENPIGFDSEQNYSTANDLKLLLEKIKSIPLFSSVDRKQLYSFTSETGKTYSVRATNRLLAADPDIHAIKTGFTDEAKGAMITAIRRENQQFIIIVLGSPNRESDTLLLKSQALKATSQ